MGTRTGGRKDKSKIRYNDILTLWKNADTGTPILKQTKAEYAILQ
jgi:hypothetical protein